MGRNENRPPEGFAGKVVVKRHKLDAQGYDETGAYFGVEAKLWFAESEDGEFYWYFRAPDFETAKTEAKRFARAREPRKGDVPLGTNPHELSVKEFRKRRSLVHEALWLEFLSDVTLDSVVPALCDNECEVEPDGVCPHGCDSILVKIGAI